MNKDRAIGLIALTVAIPVGIAAWRYGIGSPRSPGAGFWPLMIIVIMSGLGIKLLLNPDEQSSPEQTGETSVEVTSRWSLFGIAFVSLIVYAAFLETIGYVSSTALFLLVQFRLVEKYSWRFSGLIAVSAAVISLVVFKIGLKVALPDGFIPLPTTFW